MWTVLLSAWSFFDCDRLRKEQSYARLSGNQACVCLSSLRRFDDPLVLNIQVNVQIAEQRLRIGGDACTVLGIATGHVASLHCLLLKTRSCVLFILAIAIAPVVQNRSLARCGH